MRNDKGRKERGRREGGRERRKRGVAILQLEQEDGIWNLNMAKNVGG